MNRLEAFNELNTLDFFELIMSDIYQHAQMSSFDYADYSFLFQKFLEGNPSFQPEILKQLTQFVSPEQLKKVGELKQLSDEFHYVNETYSLSEFQKISIIKHRRYTNGGFHDHEFFEIAYLFTGSCHHTFRLANGNESTSLQPGDFVIIPPGLSHCVSVDGDSLMVNILIHRQTFQSTFLTQLPENTALYHFFSNALFADEEPSYILVQNNSQVDSRSCTESESSKDAKLPRKSALSQINQPSGKSELSNIDELILDLYLESKKQDYYSNRISENLLNIFFLEVLRNNETAISLSSNISEKEKLAASLLLYIENNYQRISLKEVADNFHFSKTYLNRIFKEATGTTILKYIKNLRLNEAEKLLKDPSFSVSTVAEMVGYNDTSYFIEEYKKAFGKTPKAKSHP